MKHNVIKDSGARRRFDSGAVRDIQEGKGRLDLLPACAILRVAKHFENGARKYSERNWEKGIPVHSFIDSALRHLMNYLDGKTDEDHLCAAAWNLLCAMWTEEKRPDLQDIPARQKSEEPVVDKVDNLVDRVRKRAEAEMRNVDPTGSGHFYINGIRYALKILEEETNGKSE